MKLVIGLIAVAFICLLSPAEVKADPFAEAVAEAFPDLLDKFKEYKDKFELFVKRITEQIKETWNKIKDKLQDAGEEVKKNFHKLKSKAQDLTLNAISTIQKHFPKNVAELEQLLINFEKKVVALDIKVKSVIQKVSDKVKEVIFDRTKTHKNQVADLHAKLAPSEKCRQDLGPKVDSTFEKLREDVNKCGKQALKPLESLALKVNTLVVGIPKNILKVINDAVTCYKKQKQCLSVITTVISTVTSSIAAIEALENAEVNLMMSGIMTVGCKFGFSVWEWYKANNIESKVEKCLKN